MVVRSGQSLDETAVSQPASNAKQGSFSDLKSSL